MYNIHSYRLTKEQYNHLLPVLRTKLFYAQRGICFKDRRVEDLFSFIGREEEFQDAMDRCRYLDEDLLDNPEYKIRFEYNKQYNRGIYYKLFFY